MCEIPLISDGYVDMLRISKAKYLGLTGQATLFQPGGAYLHDTVDLGDACARIAPRMSEELVGRID